MLFVIGFYRIMNFLKPHKTITEQIDILKNRGLVIADENLAKTTLETAGYYNLINGYKSPFVYINNNNEEKFIQDTKFEYLLKLYDFDTNLKSKILTKILSIEKIFKSVISYEFADKHGELNYLNENCYNTYNDKYAQKTKELISNIQEAIRFALHPKYAKNKQYDCVRHYQTNYGNIPIWIVFNILNFNNIKNFYDCLLPPTKKAIASHISRLFGLSVTQKELFNFIGILVEVRNACAHCQRLYTYTTKYDIKNNIESKRILDFVDLPINNLISILIIFKHFMSRAEFIDFYYELLISIKNLMNSIPNNYWNKIAKSMNVDLFKFNRLLEIGI